MLHRYIAWHKFTGRLRLNDDITPIIFDHDFESNMEENQSIIKDNYDSSGSEEDNYCPSDDDENIYIPDSNEDIVDDDLRTELLSESLAEWALDHKINYKALQDLLLILKSAELDVDNLPKDPRTLLTVKSSKVLTAEISGGQYWHYGLRKILEVIESYEIRLPDVLSSTINVDGVPVYKSSKKQFWPVLAKLKYFDFSPFVIGIFYGKSKPSSLDFLNNFVDEFRSLIKNGFVASGSFHEVIVDKFSLDAPAMSMVKATKGHNGFYSCGSCTIKGQYSQISRTVEFSHGDYEPLTDFSFRDFHNQRQLQEPKYIENHLGNIKSPLLKLPKFDIVKGFPKDPMHLLYLGISKKLIGFWVNKPTSSKAGKLSSRTITCIDAAINDVMLCFPSDFNRKCRSILEYHYWKAT